jgi:hypothetical protein
MLRLFIGLVTIALLIGSFAGCKGGGGDDAADNETAKTTTPAPAGEAQSRPAIPPKVEKPDWVEGVFANLYFDEEGTVTELSVEPGQTFSVYLFAEYPEPYKVAAAEFRLELPVGVGVVSRKLFRDKVLTMGNHETDFVMTFQCDSPSPGKFYLVEFHCRTGDDFQGGKIEAAAGINAKGEAFLGFVACEEPELRRLPARGGVATLTKK